MHISLSLYAESLLLITCTCCYDQIKGTQDKDFSHSFFDSLYAECNNWQGETQSSALVNAKLAKRKKKLQQQR